MLLVQRPVRLVVELPAVSVENAASVVEVLPATMEVCWNRMDTFVFKQRFDSFSIEVS